MPKRTRTTRTKRKIKTGPLLFLFLVAARLWTLTGDAAFENWHRLPASIADPVKYMKAKAELRKKQREALRKIFLLRLELLQKMLEWDSRQEQLDAFFESPSLLPERKLAELNALNLPDSVIPEDRNKTDAVSDQGLKNVIAQLLELNERVYAEVLREKTEEITIKTLIKRYRFNVLPEPPPEKIPGGGTFILARERADYGFQYRSMEEQSGPPGAAWSAAPTGFLLSIFIGIFGFFKNIFSFAVEYKEIFIIFLIAIGALVGLSVLAAFVKRRY